MNISEYTTDEFSSRRLSPTTIIFIVLLFITVGGVAVMDFSDQWAHWYWFGVSIVFAVTSTTLSVIQTRRYEDARSSHLWSQLLHWTVVTAGVLLCFLLENMEGLAPRTGGIVALLVLAIGTLLAGIHYHGRVALLGILLVVTFVAAALAEKFFWIMLIPGILVGVLIVMRVRKRQG